MVKTYSLTFRVERCVATLRDAFFGVFLNGTRFFDIVEVIMKKVFAVICSICIMLLFFGLTACNDKKQYKLTVHGEDLLYENLNATYAAGEEVTVKAKIRPYEGVKATLDTEYLVKTKSAQNEYWQFTFTMPAHNALLDITSYTGFDEPLLYGFYLTFNDKNGEPIEALSKPVDSKEAIADYAVMYWEDEPFGHWVVSDNESANVFADCKSKISDNGFELEDTLYYTYELLDAVVVIDWIHLDDLKHVYSYGGSAGYALDNLGGRMSLSTTQNLSDNRYNAQMKEYEEKFDSLVKINFVYLDYLTNVKVLEYTADNQLLKSTAIDKAKAENDYVACENCAYVVIEEEYTVKSGDKSGETHYERTLINKSELGGGMFLKYPRGDGLISPVYLSVKW